MTRYEIRESLPAEGGGRQTAYTVAAGVDIRKLLDLLQEIRKGRKLSLIKVTEEVLI